LKSTSTTRNAPRVHNHCSRRRVDQLFLLAVLFYFVIKSITAGSEAARAEEGHVDHRIQDAAGSLPDERRRRTEQRVDP
jgi:hypothetical protein